MWLQNILMSLIDWIHFFSSSGLVIQEKKLMLQAHDNDDDDEVMARIEFLSSSLSRKKTDTLFEYRIYGRKKILMESISSGCFLCVCSFKSFMWKKTASMNNKKKWKKIRPYSCDKIKFTFIFCYLCCCCC